MSWWPFAPDLAYPDYKSEYIQFMSETASYKCLQATKRRPIQFGHVTTGIRCLTPAVLLAYTPQHL